MKLPSNVLMKFTGSQKTSFSLGKIYQNMLIKLLIGIKPISVQLMSRLIWIYSVCPLVIDFFKLMLFQKCSV